MISWGEQRRNADPGYFCSIIENEPGSELPVWIISDARRRTDVKYYQEKYTEIVLNVRVIASEIVRTERGWTFTEGMQEIGGEDYFHDISHHLI